MNRWKFKIGVVLVFLLGLAIGCLATGWWFAHGFREFRGPRARVEAQIMKKLSWYLDLTEEQKTRMRPIVQDVSGKLEDLRSRAEPEIRTIIEGGLLKAKPVLSEKQYGKLERHYKDLRHKWERRHDDSDQTPSRGRPWVRPAASVAGSG